MSRLTAGRAPRISPVLGLAGATAAPPDPVVPSEPEEPPRRKKKVGGWNDYPENYERIRRAWYWTRTKDGGFESISEMIARVLMSWAEGMEREHNGGQPFPEPPKVRHSHRG